MPPTAPDPTLLGIFEAEVEETIGVIHDHLLHIEQGGPDRGALLEDVLRLAHDLKGSARVVGYELVGHLAHALEEHLMPWRQQPPAPGAADAAFRATDLFRALALDPDDEALQARSRKLIDELRGQSAAPRAAPPAAPPVASTVALPVAPSVAPPAWAPAPSAPQAEAGTARASGEILKVARAHVDAVSDDAAAMLLVALGAQVRVQDLKRALVAARRVRLPRSDAPAREVARVCRSLRELLNEVAKACKPAIETLTRLEPHARKLDDDTRKLFLVPVKSLIGHLERVARDASVALGRQVRVETEGRERHVDMALLEALKGPLTHAIRNAVDHGIEPPAEREAAGKPPHGTLRLTLTEVDNRLRLVIADDGRGIDRAAVRRRLGPGAAGLDDARLLEALLRSGVSTRDEVTEISGRGLGLGALAFAVDRLRGDIELSSQPGLGTTLTLAVPLRLSTLDGLVIEAAGNHFVLPLAALADVSRDAAPEAPALAALLGLPDTGRPMQVVKLHGRERTVSLAVDRVLDRLEVVRRPTGSHLGHVPFVEGATILPHGEPALILDAREIADACTGSSPALLAAPPGRAAGARRRILLADDSPTLRAKLHHDLCQAGFDVVLADDGQSALDRLAAITCDALVTDVQMPRLDGLELLARCAGRLPVVVITALPDAAGEARARQLGAAAYLAKDDQLGERVITILNRSLTHSQDTRP